jgi:tetratricopeptide (TPR) repeat protein
MHRPKEARKDAKAARELLPSDPRAAVAEGLALMATKDYELAKRCFKAAREMDSNYPGGIQGQAATWAKGLDGQARQVDRQGSWEVGQAAS